MNAPSQFRLFLKQFQWQLIGSGLVIAVVVGALAVADFYAGEAERLKAASDVLSGKLIEIDSQRLRGLDQLEAATSTANAASKRVVELEAALAKKPMPPRPKPAPETLPELQTVIVSFGFTPGLTILDSAMPSTLGRPDALKVYDWASQAARIAPLEDRLSASEAVIGGLKQEVAAKDAVVKTSFDALSKTTDQLLLTQEQAKVFEKQAKVQAKRALLQKWLYAGGALLTGYVVAKK